jgi:predicted secreted protein
MKKLIILCFLSILSINAMEQKEKYIQPDYRNGSEYMKNVIKEAHYLHQICEKNHFNYHAYIHEKRKEAFDLEPKDKKEEFVIRQIIMFSGGYSRFRPDYNSKKTSFETACDHYENSYCGHYLKQHPLWIKNREEIREKLRLAQS